MMVCSYYLSLSFNRPMDYFNFQVEAEKEILSGTHSSSSQSKASTDPIVGDESRRSTRTLTEEKLSAVQGTQSTPSPMQDFESIHPKDNRVASVIPSVDKQTQTEYSMCIKCDCGNKDQHGANSSQSQNTRLGYSSPNTSILAEERGRNEQTNEKSLELRSSQRISKIVATHSNVRASQESKCHTETKTYCSEMFYFSTIPHKKTRSTYRTTYSMKPIIPES